MKKLWLFFILFLTACGTNMDPFVGMEQAEQQRQFFASQLTATSEKVKIDITSTSAAFSFVQTQTAYPYTATALSWTATPVPTATPNAAATLAMANAEAQATQMANETAMSNMKRQRQEYTNKFWAAILPIFLLMLLLVVGYVGVSISRERRMRVIERGDDKPLFINRVTGEIIDADLMPNYSTGGEESLLRQAFEQWMETKGFTPKIPRITAERQDVVKQRDQLIDMKARTSVKSAAVMKLLEDHGMQRRLTEPTANMPEFVDGELFQADFPLPAWEIANGWDGKDGIPYGIHARGLGLMDLNKNPHRAAFGETGSGKSRRFLRPFITFALAAGHRVVILGKQVDFLPFVSHPNAYIIPIRELTLETEAMKYALFLKALVDEMNKRDEYLSAQHKSTWAQAGRETTVVILDEYTNAMDLMPRQYAETSRRFVKGLLREGRKYGFSMALSAQRAVGLRDEVTQLGRAVFRVADTQESRYALGMPGAEGLKEGYFMAKFGALNMAGAFEPTDEEIASFLRSRQVRPLEHLPWLDANLLEVKAREVEPSEESPEEDEINAETRDKVLKLLQEGMSISSIIRSVWNVSGGSKYLRLNDKVKELKIMLEGA